MSLLSLIHLACLTAAAEPVPGATPTSPVNVPTPPAAAPTPPTVHTARLSGGDPAAPVGAAVLLVERRDLPVVRVELSFETGALVAAGRVSRGALDALGAAWGEGTRDLPGDPWRAAVEARGGLVDAGCANVRCWLTLTAPREALPALASSLGDLVRSPALPGDAVRRWRRVALADWRTTCQSRSAVEAHAVGRLLWPEGHPYRDERDRDELRATPGQLRDTWRTVVTEARPTVVVVGDTSLAEALPPLEASLGRLAGATGGPTPFAFAPEPRVVLVDDPGAGPARLTVAWPGPAYGDVDHAAWQLVATALVDGFASRLNLRLRERDGLTYGVDGAYRDEPGYGVTTVELAVSPEDAGRALAALHEELDRMRFDGPTADELAAALHTGWARASAELGAFSELAWTLWVERHFDLSPGETVRRLATYREVSLLDARAAAARWLAAPRVVVVTGEHEDLAPALADAGIVVSDRWTAGDAVSSSGECPGGD